MSRRANLARWISSFGCWVCLVSAAPAQPPAAPMRWLAHDLRRPHPPVVSPGEQKIPAPVPADAVVLFDGTTLDGWRTKEGEPARWVVRDGYMESVPNSGYVYTRREFGDVQLHVEWAAPTPAKGHGQGRGNSGVFLMSLYEVQVLDSFENETYADGQAAAIYGQYPPLANACLPPGQWQQYDITFRRPRFDATGAATRPGRISVVHNGVLAQDNVALWGPSTWLQALPYEDHGTTGSLGLQDHGNPVRYRNIWLRELPDDTPTAPPAESDRQPLELTREQLAGYTGVYRTPLGPFAEIRLHDAGLRLHMEAGQVIDLLPVAPDGEFVFRWTAAKLVFQYDDARRVTGATMHLAGEQYPLKRQVP